MKPNESDSVVVAVLRCCTDRRLVGAGSVTSRRRRSVETRLLDEGRKGRQM
jgi:hypothetical protein